MTGGTAGERVPMRKLVSMPDEERERLVDDFWNEVGEGLDVPSDSPLVSPAARSRSAPPRHGASVRRR
ncbi:hypothetical protein ACIBQX_35555 [Nonomuraea sp. NPDC049714]|uniref:hypothetical protein n=1 Tax=Nonomuraea sp. NPDC049714 TaxID=3364357 RepID=UPI0037999407